LETLDTAALAQGGGEEVDVEARYEKKEGGRDGGPNEAAYGSDGWGRQWIRVT
jgi:hypothetical protein